MATMSAAISSESAGYPVQLDIQYPEGLFKLQLGIQRCGARVFAYGGLLVDWYPPFSMK